MLQQVMKVDTVVAAAVKELLSADYIVENPFPWLAGNMFREELR